MFDNLEEQLNVDEIRLYLLYWKTETDKTSIDVIWNYLVIEIC